MAETQGVDGESLPVLGLTKAANARDLGGYRTVDGREVRRGLLYRADALHRLDDDDVAVLAGLKLACLVDFRSEDEIEKVGLDRLPDPAPDRLVNLPLYDPEHNIFVSVGVLLGRLEAGEVSREDVVLDGVAVMSALYRWFVSAAFARAAFADALRLVATPGSLPLLFHCTAGKDRTGWLSAVILTTLGVDRETVIRDYLRTNEFNAAGNEFFLARLAERLGDATPAIPLMEARREYLEVAFAEADRCYGGLEGYVRDGLGLNDATVASLHDTLLI